MTQQPVKTQKEHQQLSPVEKEESHKTQNDEENSHQDMNNVLPLTHANEKKKRKHRSRKLKKFSPEHYEEIRIRKLNRKLQEKWDSHFINDQIPDLFEKKKVHVKTLSKLGNAADKRSATGLNSRMPPSRPTDLAVKKQTMPLPKISKGCKRSTSFNVHIVGSKQMEAQANKSKQNPSPLSDPKLSQTSNKKQRRISQLQKQSIQQKGFQQEYKKTLTNLFEQKKFLNCHKEMLDLFIQKIGKKHIRQILDQEFELLKKSESIINKIMKAIENRQKFIESLNLLADKEEVDEKELLEAVDYYRTSTLAVVELILKWKGTWQEAYLECFKKQIAFDLVYKAHNYLFTLASSVDETIKKLHQQRSKQQQSNQTKKPQALQNHQQKEEAVGQQIDKTKKDPQQQNSNYPNVPQQKVQKKNDQNKVQQPPKEIKKQNILLNDPFLISLFDIGKEDKNFIIKIRACELLLIQEQFNFLKM